MGVAFKHQVVVGDFIVDFLCAQSRVVIEVDGAYHAARKDADARRDRFFRRQGYRVVRVAADDVLHDLSAVLATVLVALAESA